MPKPEARPANVPTRPTSKPWTIKIVMMLLAEAPMALRIATSLVFSMTTITSVLIMFRAPTSTIMVKMTNMANFSSLSAEKRLLFITFQSLVQYGLPNAFWIFSPTLSDLYTSLTLTSRPLTRSPNPRNACASLRETNTMEASYSYIPESKTAVTLYFCELGTLPIGVNFPSGEIIFRTSPG